MRNVRQDVVGVFIYAVLGAPAVAEIRHPIFALLLSLMIAGAPMPYRG